MRERGSEPISGNVREDTSRAEIEGWGECASVEKITVKEPRGRVCEGGKEQGIREPRSKSCAGSSLPPAI